MEDDHRELVRNLFAAMTEMTETAYEAGIAGQSEALTAGGYVEAARQLEATARRPAALAGAAAVIAGPDDSDPAGRADQTPWNDRSSRRFLRAAQAPLRRRSEGATAQSCPLG